MTSAADPVGLSCLKPVIAVALAAALTGCFHSERLEEFGGPTMGSTYTVKYVRTGDVAPQATLKAETEAILREVDEQVSTYRPDSLIARFNQAGAGTCQVMPQGVLDMVEVAQRLHRETDGGFDITLGPLLDLWGFGPNSRGEHVPRQSEIDSAMRRVGQDKLRVKGDQLCKDAALTLDFNAIAAGYTVDRIIARLAELGVVNTLVEVTGELKAVGSKPDGQPWRIALEEPRDDQRVIQRILKLDGYGVSTSGDYRNYFEQDGQRYSHTLDPILGMPVAHRLAAVSVVHRSTLMADGLSTVLLVLGPDEGWDYALEHELAAFFIVRDGKQFISRATPEFERLFPEEGK